tara:strand:+ start:1388 stop:2407 length:1020 start_codon:yes stop_codon:yes gene_type:complete
MPKVSVLMPVHNGEKYLYEAIDSILCQSYTDFEIIIIDDASTDNSLEIIRKFKYDKLILIKNVSNIGQAESENIGLNMANGKYIARLDQDDMMVNNRIEKQVQFLDNHEQVAAVGSQYWCINSVGEKIKRLRWPIGLENNLFSVIVGHVPIGDPGVMYRNEVAQSMRGYKQKYEPAEDYDLWLRLYLNGYECDNLDEYLTLYRSHSKQISIKKHDKQVQKHQLAFIDFAYGLGIDENDIEKVKQYLNIICWRKKPLTFDSLEELIKVFNLFFDRLNNIPSNKNKLKKKYLKQIMFEYDYRSEYKENRSLLKFYLNNNMFFWGSMRLLIDIFSHYKSRLL